MFSWRFEISHANALVLHVLHSLTKNPEKTNAFARNLKKIQKLKDEMRLKK